MTKKRVKYMVQSIAIMAVATFLSFFLQSYGIQKEKKVVPDLKKELNQFQHEFQFDMNRFQQPEQSETEFSKIEEHVDSDSKEDMNKNMEFLDSLKEFRKNLE